MPRSSRLAPVALAFFTLVASADGPWPPGSPEAVVWTIWTTESVNLEFARKTSQGVFNPLPLAKIEAAIAEPFINKRIEALREATKDAPLHERSLRPLRESLVASGLPVQRNASYLAEGVHARRLLERLELKIYENHRDRSFLTLIIDPMVSPDLRQLHLATYFRVYRAGRSIPVKEGELHWLSDPIGDAAGPEDALAERWAAEDGKLFLATLDHGLAELGRMLKLAMGEMPSTKPTQQVMYRDQVASEVRAFSADDARIVYAFANDVMVSEPRRSAPPAVAAREGEKL